MRNSTNSTKEIVNKLLNKSKKSSFESSKSTLKSDFSFKNSSASKNSSKFSNKPSKTNNGFDMDKKIFQQIFEILKMRLFIESIMNMNDEVIKDIMKENIKLINLKDYDIQSINKFVDDLVEIIKEENKKIKLQQENKLSVNSIDQSTNENLNESNEFSLKLTRRNTIQLNNNGYRPTSVAVSRRRTIEYFIEKPTINSNIGAMKFNMYDKTLKKNYSFYEGDHVDPKKNNKNYDSEGLGDFRNRLIEEVQMQD